MRMLAPDGPAAWAGSAARYSLPLDTDQVYRANSALHTKNQAPENDTKRMTKPSAAVLARRCVAGSTGSTTRRNNNARRVFSPLLLRRLVCRNGLGQIGGLLALRADGLQLGELGFGLRLLANLEVAHARVFQRSLVAGVQRQRLVVGRKRLVVFAEPTVGVAQQVIGIGVLRILGHHLAEAAGGQRPVLGFDGFFAHGKV